MIYESINIPLWHELRALKGKRVLDIGCGTGSLGELLRDNGNHVDGVTWSHQEANIASARIDRVHVLDLNKLEDEMVPFDDHFDVMIFADVLEHLIAPERTLGTLLKYLKPNGQVLVSLPNIACFYIRFGLLVGYFEMSSAGGILDETHLHFYTARSAQRLLSAAGLHVVKRNHMPAISVWLYQFVKKNQVGVPKKMKDRKSFQFYERWIYPAERIATSFWKGMFANQFVFVCRKHQANEG